MIVIGNMRKRLTTLLALVAALATGVGYLDEVKADEGNAGVENAAEALLERAFRNLYADDYVQLLRLSTSFRGGRETSRVVQITRRQSTSPGKALLRFTWPKSIRRTSVLILENEDRNDDLYVYMPSLKRTKHLASSQRGDAFFGTDLAYEDVEPKETVDWEIDLLGEGSHEGHACRKLALRPRDDFESTYERMVTCIEEERGVALWTDFYRRGKVVKRLETDPADIRAVGGRFIPFTMTVTTPGRRSQTVVSTESYELRDEIPDSLFSTWNLEVGDARRDRNHAGEVRAAE
jgi:hypothetical protein